LTGYDGSFFCMPVFDQIVTTQVGKILKSKGISVKRSEK
jgi:hypothetical protein